MSISKPNVIDWLGIEKVSGHVIATIIDDLTWDDENSHILALQDKINCYLSFIESGEIYESLSRDLNRQVPRTVPVRISILAKFPPSGAGRAFISYVSATVVSAGFGFSFKVLDFAE